jgi:hypothetical protein
MIAANIKTVSTHCSFGGPAAFASKYPMAIRQSCAALLYRATIFSVPPMTHTSCGLEIRLFFGGPTGPMPLPRAQGVISRAIKQL